MGSDFPWLPIGDLVDRGHARLQTGPFGSQLHKHDYADEGIPVIPTEGIGRGRIIANASLPLINQAKADELSRHRLMLGDILFARRGIQATGLSAIVDEVHVGSICGTGALLLRVNPKTVDPRFLAAYLSTTEAFDWLRSNAVGAVMPNLNTSIISRLRVPMPPMEVQGAVGHFVGCLDDRIDLLRQTNTTLEAIAQTLFKSWFIDFDPVRAKSEGREPEGMDAATAALFPSEFEESELGSIPKGWRVMPLRESFDINPRRSLAKGLTAPYLDMASVPVAGHVPAEPIERAFYSGTKFQNGDTLFARITPCLENGKTAHVDFLRDDQVGWGSTEFIVLKPKSPVPPYFGYLLARHDAFRAFAIQAMTGTSGRQRVELGQLERYRIVSPTEPVAIAFGHLVELIRSSISADAQRGNLLTQLRDTLLPRLISGKLRLPQAEILIEESVA